MIKLIHEGIRKAATGGYIHDTMYDYPTDLIELTGNKIYRGEVFENVYWFGYKFTDAASRKDRQEFIDYIKGLSTAKMSNRELEEFIDRPLAEFIHEVDMSSIKALVYPRSGRSPLASQIIGEFGSMMRRGIKGISYEALKSAPKNVSFDWDRFDNDFVGDDNQYTQIRAYVEEDLMPKIHQLGYFSLASSVKPKYRKYITNYLIFPEKASGAIKALGSGNVVIIDDICTSGATVEEMVRLVREINTDCTIYIFTLIGR